MKYCPKCKYIPVQVVAAFCINDGTALEELPKCSACGTQNIPAAKFCQKCGAKLYPPVYDSITVPSITKEN